MSEPTPPQTAGLLSLTQEQTKRERDAATEAWGYDPAISDKELARRFNRSMAYAHAIRLDLGSVRYLARQGVSIEQVGTLLGVDPRTVTRWKDPEDPCFYPEFYAIFHFGRAQTALEIGAAQVDFAKAGNHQMLKLCGMHYLGQRETKELTGAGGGAIQVQQKLTRGLDKETLDTMTKEMLGIAI